MPLSKKDVEVIKKKRKEIHWKLLNFFNEHPGQYFTKEEIAEEIIPKDEDESNVLRDELFSMVIRIYGDVEILQKDGKMYFGKEMKKNEW